MLGSFSRLISILLHPALMPLAGMLVVLFFTPTLSWYPLLIKQLILYTVLLGAFLLPLLFIPFYKWIGLIDSVYMHHHKERVFPMLITACFYFFTFLALHWMFNTNPDLSTSIIARLTRHFLLATATTAFASGLISYWWKISIHMVAMGGLLGLLLMLVKVYSFDNLIIVVLVLLLSGLVGASRIEQESHDQQQVYVGYLFGVGMMFAMMLGFLQVCF